MTTETQNPPAADNMVLDDFNEAMGDGLPESGATTKPRNPTVDEDARDAAALEAVYDIPVNITVVLGRTHVEVSELLALDKGAVIELDRKVGEAIDIFVNNRLVARGEVVLVDDRLGITMTEIIRGDQIG